MKLIRAVLLVLVRVPAAFRRLCVETKFQRVKKQKSVPAAFRRLCVETMNTRSDLDGSNPAAFRRLCVETC